MLCFLDLDFFLVFSNTPLYKTFIGIEMENAIMGTNSLRQTLSDALKIFRATPLRLIKQRGF